MNKKISDIGRQGLIRKLSASAGWRSDLVIQGIGDDAAVLEKDEHSYSLVSSETFVEGVEFDLSFMPFHQVGAKAISAAVSDIYAMNGRPEAVLVNLGIPNRITVEMIEELYKGIGMACSDYACQLAGGDLTGSHNALVISVTAYGVVEKESITYNRGARRDDAICVTGDLGGALAGLKILLREKKHWEDSQDPVMQPDLSDWDYIVKRQLVPVARKDVISIFREHQIIPSSMVDISQGLIHDLNRLFADSRTGAYIYQAAIPIDLQTRQAADEMKEDVDKYALYGGEDFELLFTAGEKEVTRLAEHFSNFAVIGKVTDDGGKIEMQSAEGDVISFEPE
ncbi:thiamine-phosphate kinase [Balneolales bacterium ANBcel1]|nr:thiamine-phosphate kinase [Balneolales bacterium ANBcel1]